ncbi:MAG: SCP2 sterol-binding domain-containing protein [Acidimicrobiales bacterium]
MARIGKGRAISDDPTEHFFEDLASRGEEPLLHNISGSLRIDITDGATTRHFHITVDGGHVDVSHRIIRADAIVRVERALFNEMAEGKMNPLAAFLRGRFTIEGDPGLMTSLTRLFPGPPSSQKAFLKRQEEEAT